MVNLMGLFKDILQESNEAKIEDYIAYIEDVKSAIQNKEREFKDYNIAKLYYDSILKSGVKYKFISDKLRRKINKEQRKLNALSIQSEDLVRILQLVLDDIK